VTLAAALAIPSDFPYRDLIVLTAFAVVLGTLVIQGLTLKPLLRALNLQDGDPVGQEVRLARERALHAGLDNLANERSSTVDAVRREFAAHLSAGLPERDASEIAPTVHGELHRRALAAARRAIATMRTTKEIGDDAFHEVEEELDWLEMAERTEREER